MWAVLMLGGCLHEASNRCDDGGVCGPGLHCGMAGDMRICVASSCGDGQLDVGEACDDGNNVSGDGCPADCRAPCGDGVLDPGEHCDDGNLIDGDGCDSNCTVTVCGNGIVTAGEVCDDGNAIDGDGCDRDCTGSALAQQAYTKASNTDYDDVFGTSVALSADGTTLAVGAPGEASAATGIAGDQTDNSAPGAGAVYVFTRHGARWRQQAYIKASNANAGDGFGTVVALSADGSSLAVGAPGEDSAATAIDGDQGGNTAKDAGAVYVFTRSDMTWHQAAYVKASNTNAGDGFGTGVALSADGTTLAVGAAAEASAATGVGGDQTDNSAKLAGAAYVFVRSGETWTQEAYVKASNTEALDAFGSNVALSGDGSILAVSADQEDSAATGIGGDQASNAAPGAGAVYLFTRTGTTWRQQAYVKASNTGAVEYFGSGLALSADGTTLAVGAYGERSAATGIGGDQEDESAADTGAVYVFANIGAHWSQQVYIKASNTSTFFGKRLSLSSDGARLAVGADGETSAATGIGDNQSDHSAQNAGAVYLFARGVTTWTQQAYIKASNTGPDDFFGGSVALSGDSTTLAVGGPGDDSIATGIDGNQIAEYSAASTGAVYIFH